MRHSGAWSGFRLCRRADSAYFFPEGKSFFWRSAIIEDERGIAPRSRRQWRLPRLAQSAADALMRAIFERWGEISRRVAGVLGRAGAAEPDIHGDPEAARRTQGR